MSRMLLAIVTVLVLVLSFSPSAMADSYLRITVGGATIFCDNSTSAGVTACAANGFSTALASNSISTSSSISIGGYTIGGAGVTGNQPGTATQSYSLGNEFNVENVTANQALIIDYASNNFVNSASATVGLSASQAATFTAAQPGDTQRFTGYGNAANTLAATGTPDVTPDCVATSNSATSCNSTAIPTSFTRSGNFALAGHAEISMAVGGQASYQTTVAAIPPGSISLSKTPDGATFNSGQQLTFTMVVSSNGPGTAQNVTLKDPLPTTGGLTWSVSSVSAGICNIDPGTQVLSCSFGDLANGETRTVTVASQATTPAAACNGSKINNTATASAAGLPDVVDTGSYSCGCQFSATSLEFTGHNVTFSVTNGNAAASTLSQIALSWPNVNGKLTKVLLGSKTVYDNPDLSPPSATITTFAGTTSDRTIPAGGSALLTLQFASNADTNDAHYSGTFSFGSCNVTIPAGCVLGYPYASTNPLTNVIFNESGVLQQINPLIATTGGTIQAYATDEHAPLLGVRTATMPVSPLPSNPGHVSNPLVGDPTIADPSGRLIHPGLFITDVTGISDNASHTLAAYRAGDWQYCSSLASPPGNGCLGVAPDDVFGTWKGAAKSGTSLVTDADPSVQNHWNLGPGSDTPTGGFSSLDNLGYSTEFRWNVSNLAANGQPLQSGHTYRVQVIVHDGDQNKTGGDVGQACALVNIQ